MPEFQFVLRCLLLHNLIESANAYGISYPTFLKAAKQLSQLVAGTMVTEITSNGLSWALLTQAITDTRSLHF